MTGGDTFDVHGRTVFVTGSSRGIGRAIAVGFAIHGADVVLHYVNDEASVADAAAQIKALGRDVHVVQGDIGVSGAGVGLAAQVVDVAPIDILVLNAGVHIRRPFLDDDPEALEREIQGDFVTNLDLLRKLVPPMAERRWGRVLTVGSVQQVRPNPALVVYASLKSAMSNVVVNIARMYAKDGVTCNNLAPGMIETDATAPQFNDDEVRESVFSEIPMGFGGVPDDVVGAALLLGSDAGRYITGQTIFVDGGMNLPGRAKYIGPEGQNAS